MKTIAKFFIMFMSIKKVQELFLEMAEMLAQKTTNKIDDKAVELVKGWVENE